MSARVIHEVKEGQVFGEWTVIDPLVVVLRKTRYPRRCAKVECSCGHKKVVQITDLIDGSSKSCKAHNKAHLGPNED